MPSSYSIIQYVPDSTAAERINIGVIAYDDTRVQCRVLKKWDRVKCFAGPEVDIKFLQEIAQGFLNACSPQKPLIQLDKFERLTPENVITLAERWQNSIQLTEFRGMLMPLEQVLPFAERRCLKFRPAVERRQVRTRASAKMLGYDSFENAIAEELGPALKDLLHRNEPVVGTADRHQMDVALANGQPYFVMNCHSFEGKEPDWRDDQLSSTKWAATDLRSVQDPVSMAVLVLPPGRPTTSYNEFIRVMRALNVQIVEENEVRDYARSVVSDLPVAKDETHAIQAKAR